MNEREYHDLHYETEAARIQGTALFERVHERAARQFLRATRAGPRHRILSLGCGDGSIERRLAPRVAEIVGIDLSGVAIRQAREKCAAAGLRNVTFRVADAGSLPKQELGQFDVVAAFAFLHHLKDDQISETLRASRERLRPGGVFYSTDPSRRRLVRFLAPLVCARYDRYHSPDERELQPSDVCMLAMRAGFGAPVIDYVDYFLGPLAWLAPRTPSWLARVLEPVDDLALTLPFVRRFASSFSLLAAV